MNRGVRGQLGRVAFRLYVAAYCVVFGLGFLKDLGGDVARPIDIAPRTSAIAGALITAVVIVVASFGRSAVALRPSSAEVQLALLSPAPRTLTLARSIGVTSTASIVAAGAVALALMLTSAAQFAGLNVAVQLAYVAFAASVGFIAFGAHLLVAERRYRLPLAAVALALAVLAGADVVRASSISPFTFLVRALRSGAPLLSVVGPAALGGVLAWRANADAERIPFEKVSRGSDLADRAEIALAGNDVRTLLMLQRSLGALPWRPRPRIRVGARFARRFPVLGRSLRAIARWRAYRWLFVLTTSAAIGALLRVHPANIRTIALAAVSLWFLGFVFCEPLAQEHDRTDRLALLPKSRGIEYRHVTVSWCLTFVWLLPVLVVGLHGRASAASTLALAAAGAVAATASAAISFRRPWKLLTDRPSAYAGAPEAAGTAILVSVLWPAAVAAICLAPWSRNASGLTIVVPAVIVAVGLALWIAKDAVNAFINPMLPVWMRST
ncbi:MAG: hypothetical protein QOI61_403 [Actinomycetota bacterium]